MRAPDGLRVIDRRASADVPDDVLDFLRVLGGPCALYAAGRDRARRRVIVTLLHGNEPSGVRAVHSWLRSGAVPAVDTLLVLGAVETALLDGGFRHRAAPGQPDLNRMFGEGASGPVADVAASILAAIEATEPEAVLDIHNNSGHNPAYGVVPRLGPLERAVVQLFSDLAIVYDLHIGSLIEVTAGRYPTIAVETGRAGAPEADEIARAGLERFLAADDLLGGDGVDASAPLTVLADPVRVRVRAGARVAFADRPQPGVALTVAPDLDRHNFERLEPGARLGWVENGSWPLEAHGADGIDRSRELFRLDGRALVTSRVIVPVMITTDPVIAVDDCLLYVVSPAPAAT